MFSSPTGGHSQDVFIAGASGNIWRFSTQDCSLMPGWPVQVANNAAITGPVMVYGDSIIAAAQDGHVAMFKYDNPMVPAPGFDANPLINPQIANGSPLQGWHIVGSPALVNVWDQNSSSNAKTLLLFSISSAGAGALVGIDVNGGTLAGMIQTAGPLVAGPSVGYLSGAGSVTHIAIVPELNLTVHGINIDGQWAQSWAPNLAGQLQQGEQFQGEASVTGDSVYLTTGSYLVGLSLATGQLKWAPVALNDSPTQAPAVADNGNVYLVVGFYVRAFSTSNGAQISATTPSNTQGLLDFRPSIAKDGSVLVGDSRNILEFR